MRKHAIITGDIINSTSLKSTQLRALVGHFSKALKQWNKDFVMKSEISRGDSFQCYLSEPVHALQVALVIKTYLRSYVLFDVNTVGLGRSLQSKNKVSMTSKTIDARIAIGIGEVELKSKKLSISNGRAFELSGKLLDKMKGKKQAIGISTDDDHLDELEVEMALIDAILSMTTPYQSEVLHYKLLGYTEVEIAKILKINQSAVNQRSNGGNWYAIEVLLNRFEKLYAYE